MQNYNSHALKLYSGNDLHYLNLRDGKGLVDGFGANQPVHEIRYTDVSTGLENQPIMVRGLHVDIGGQTTGVGYKLGDLQTQLDNEISSRQSGDATFQSIDDLSSLVDSNKDASDSSISTLTSDLANLATLVDSNNTSNGSSVSSEVTRALAAEGALDASITYLEGGIAALVQQ